MIVHSLLFTIFFNFEVKPFLPFSTTNFTFTQSFFDIMHTDIVFSRYTYLPLSQLELKMTARSLTLYLVCKITFLHLTNVMTFDRLLLDIVSNLSVIVSNVRSIKTCQ